MLIFPKICKVFLFVVCLASSFKAFGGKVDSLLVFSKAMKKSMPCTIIVPDTYTQRADSFPVLYLLNGYSGWHSNWILRVPELAQLADDFNTIIVCPEGGRNSWYFDSPLDPSSQYETFVGQEVPAFIDSAYRSRKSRMARMISGLSMGGHGALFIALRHPETFGLAGSMSGGLDLKESKGKYEIAEKIGDSTRWNNYSVISMINTQNASQLKILIDCGVDDFFLQGNRAVHQKLVQLRVPHMYFEKEGGHSWDYWRRSIPYHLFFFRQQMMSIAR